jgi:(p)ppGpp synthase/HD superfamily hydrolase
MTKLNPNKALETFIDTNSLRIRVKEWVKKNIEHDSNQIGRTALDTQKEELPMSG